MIFEVDNLLDLLRQYDEKTVIRLLSEFVCVKNPEIDEFVHYKAIDFAKRGLAITYLVYSEDGRLLGIFALANKMLTIDTLNISTTIVKKLKLFGKYDAENASITAPGILIAQLGKNDVYHTEITGKDLMALAERQIAQSLYNIGGRIVYLECEHKQALFSFYESCHYRSIGDRIQKEHEMDDIQYRVYLKFIDPVKLLDF